MYSTLTTQTSPFETPLVPEIRLRILVSRLNPERVLEMVEYADGRFGIQQNGVQVGAPWELRRIEECVVAYCALVGPEQPRLRRAADGNGRPSPAAQITR